MEQTQATQQTDQPAGQQAANDPYQGAGGPTPLAPPPRKLERRDAMVAGVAGGLGAFFNIDPTIIRVLIIVATFVSGPVVPLMYVAAWVIMPEAADIRPAPPTPAAAPPAPAQPTTTGRAPSSWAPTAAPTDVAADTIDDGNADSGSEVTAAAGQN